MPGRPISRKNPDRPVLRSRANAINLRCQGKTLAAVRCGAAGLHKCRQPIRRRCLPRRNRRSYSTRQTAGLPPRNRTALPDPRMRIELIPRCWNPTPTALGLGFQMPAPQRGQDQPSSYKTGSLKGSNQRNTHQHCTSPQRVSRRSRWISQLVERGPASVHPGLANPPSSARQDGSGGR